jgi:deoxyribodipyrimidine photo-lyase
VVWLQPLQGQSQRATIQGMPSAATPAVPRDFPPTVEAARARLAAVRPADYAGSRNHLNGAVTRLSPYLTHGLLTLAEVVDTLRAAHRLPLTHKLMQELGWRAFFRHAWRHDGERILESLHPGPLPDAAYGTAVPEDVRAGATGVPVIDQAVRTLYATGYLHNHARMWLASYLVHIRKVHWRAGADWMVAHLLDGDLGSNHLSWQWVAGTASAKPYLFNADNVAKYAPPDWHSVGTAIDQSYAALDSLARSGAALPPEPGAHPRVSEPPRFPCPLEGGYGAPDPAAVAGQGRLAGPPVVAGRPTGGLPARGRARRRLACALALVATALGFRISPFAPYRGAALVRAGRRAGRGLAGRPQRARLA